MLDNIWILDIAESNSSLIRKIEYDGDLKKLTVYFRSYYTDSLTYENVEKKYFDEFASQKSIGKYYLHFIKPNFSLTKNKKAMAEKPKTKNMASLDKRFIKISVNVREIIKGWLHEGEKGTYLNLTLVMKPDGEVDQFGNLGFVVQDVPTKVYKEDKTAKGPILGNACEIDWEATRGKAEIQPGGETGIMYQEGDDSDLPF